MPPMQEPQRIKPKSLGDYLEIMTKAVFQTGISWKVVENKWPDIRAAFGDFDAAHVAGLNEEDIDRLAQDPRVIRNYRKLLGTKEWYVIHHTDCGMETFSDEIMRGLLHSSLDTSHVDENGWHDHGASAGSAEGDYIDWLTIDDHTRTVTADVLRIRQHPLVPARIPIYGMVYDVKTGRLNEVPEAMAAGKAG